jgi:hypothetical protein
MTGRISALKRVLESLPANRLSPPEFGNERRRYGTTHAEP